MIDLKSITDENNKRRHLKALTTPGPWYVRLLDDNLNMNLVAVSVVPDNQGHSTWPDFDPGTIISATLVQSPLYVNIKDEHWDENANFIVACRNDPVEETIDQLIGYIKELESRIDKVAKT